MPPIGKETTGFVLAREAIQALLERGSTRTVEERDLIEFNAVLYPQHPPAKTCRC